ncbi:P-loop containing nucleoside triphosphate hydrolase protein [Amylostereum chailletii]|nr:P-loop containing nucleoside triphosphate hydrolase protein [Amylostereum chailletii]
MFLASLWGCEETLTSANSRLDRQAYEKRSGGDVDYRLFEAYLQIKADRGDQDVADRTHALLRFLTDKGVPGQMIDYLYVDEVQDNLIIDIFLMRMLCRNAGGLFWAGDTAQTISFGSAFRFTELKATMYRYERSNRALRVSRSMREPPTFQLLTNYRSPGGIVDCAHSVVELLQLFPNVIDNLDKESGIMNGVKPLFVHLHGDVDTDRFFSASCSSTFGLGSNQCVLVRNEAARLRLERLAGDVGVVLTLHDSKGLEFDDDSTVGSTQWRHLVGSMNEDTTVRSLQLQDRRHTPLANELKFLYVAITRTRRNLWIVDESNVCEHMKGLVELGGQATTLNEFRDTSADQSWMATAQKLFLHGHFLQAARAFLRAGCTKEAALAKAYEARKLADKIPLTREKPRQDAYKAAALALLDAATGISERLLRIQAFKHAAECYAKVKLFEPAAKAYGMAEMWTEAALHFFDANLLESALAMVQEHDPVDKSVREEIVNEARFSYLQQVKLEEAEKLFESYEEQKEFMVAHKLHVAHAAASEHRGDNFEAAQLYHAEGDTWKAVDLLLKDISDPRSQRLIKNYVWHLPWQNTSLGGRGSWDHGPIENMIATIRANFSIFNDMEKGILIRVFRVRGFHI